MALSGLLLMVHLYVLHEQRVRDMQLDVMQPVLWTGPMGDDDEEDEDGMDAVSYEGRTFVRKPTSAEQDLQLEVVGEED